MLRRELGVVTTARVLAQIALAQARGEPFAGLGPPADRREELTRRQLGPAALLLRALRRHVSVGRAERLTHAAIEAGGLSFLGALLGDLDPATVGDVRAEVRERLGRFFNAEGEVQVGEGEARYTVSRCLFVELAPKIGAAALMPAFCAVDETYFHSGLTPLRLRRPETLAGGGARCDFRFGWDPG